MTRSFALLLVFLFVGFQNSLAQYPDSATVVETAKRRIKILCADSMAGRGYTHNGHRTAARYLASEFQRFGLQPLAPLVGKAQPYLQPFRFETNLIESAQLFINKKPLQLGVDYLPHAETAAAEGKYALIDGDEVLQKKHAHKCHNKIVLFREIKGAADTAAGKGMGWRMKQALQAGAKGFILVQEKLTGTFAENQFSFPAFILTTKALESIGDLHSVEFSLKAKLQTIESQNVAGIVRGTRFPDSAIVVCAHYDHLGQIDNTIFYGANDNASGTSFLLALAEYFGQNPPPYSLVFVAFSAEEAGLHGSIYYAMKRPLYPLSQTRFVLNFDLIGNGEDGVMAVGGKDFPEIYLPLVRMNERMGLISKIAMRPNAANSDHYPFTVQKKQALFFYTMGGSTCYHDPCDRPEAIKLPAFYNFFKLIAAFLQRMPE